MRPVTLAYLYLRRLRTHPLQELLAGIGIAIGVALTFAVQVANHSVTGSARRTADELSRTVPYELTARGPHGVDERVVREVQRLRGVSRAAGILEQSAVLGTPGREPVAVHVAGVNFREPELGGLLRGSLSVGGLDLQRGIVLPAELAAQLGLRAGRPQPGRAGPPVTLHIRGRAVRVEIAAIPSRSRTGAFADSRSIVMSRSRLQRIARLPNKVTRVLVGVRPGREASVRRQLAIAAAGQLTVITPQDDVRLLEQATGPSDRATTFFTLIAVLVGWLLAFNAMLLSAPERRRLIADLRIQGFRASQLIQLALFQAAVLGVIASVAGLAVGRLLAHGVLHEPANYLTGAFNFGTETVVPRSALVLSFAGGVAAACLAAAPALTVLRGRSPVSPAEHDAGDGGPALGPATRRRLAAAALALLLGTSLLLALVSSLAIVAVVGLAGAMLLAIPATFSAVVHLADRLSQWADRLTMPVLALLLVRATTLRSLSLAATGALAVFGAVAVGSAREDLMRGIERFSERYAASADLWVVHPVDNQTTKDFPAGGLPQRLASIAGVAAVRPYRGGYLNMHGQRVWVIAHPAAAPEPVPRSEIVEGDADRLAARLRHGGWITVSEQLAERSGSDVGQTLVLPAPTGDVRFRVAATTTNFGWSAGTIVLTSSAYRRAWGSADPSALEVDLLPGVEPELARTAVRDALGAHSALEVQTPERRSAQANAAARAGLARLGQISGLLLIGAALAMAAAMSAAMWQRRPSLAALRLQGLRPGQLWRVLLSEAAVVLVAGCLSGALAGIYGQFLIDRYLRLTTGFAAPFTPAGWPALESFVLLVVMALAGVAIPGYVAARTPARLGLQE